MKMKVGVASDERLKEISAREGLAFADALKGFAMEDVLRRIYDSDFREFLWLRSSDRIGVTNYSSRSDAVLEFYYVPSDRYIPEHKLVAGQALSGDMEGFMRQQLFADASPEGLQWSVEACGKLQEELSQLQRIDWKLRGRYHDLDMDLAMHVQALDGRELHPQRMALPLLMEGNRPLTITVYAAENRLAVSFLEIMEKLELISDMKHYDVVNEILKSEVLGGRHIMEMLCGMTAAKPRILRRKRLEQLAGYRDYAYMRKRWEQYRRIHKLPEESWEEVMDRLLRFAEPIWTALCRNEVFLDDWMPGLSRFLN